MTPTPTAPRQPAQLLTCLPIIIGLAVLDEQMHGPIVLGISLWPLHRKWAAMEEAALGQATSAWGWLNASPQCIAKYAVSPYKRCTVSY